MSSLITYTPEESAKIHEMIADIYTITSIKEMRRKFNTGLKELLDYDYACFDLGKTRNYIVPYTIDPVITSTFSKEKAIDFNHQYESKFSAVDHLRWTFSSDESFVYRITDLLNDKIRRKAAFYRDFLQPFDLDFAAGIVLAKNAAFLGALTLFRVNNKENFSERDMAILETFLPHLEKRFLLHAQNSYDSKKMANESHFLKNDYEMTRREIEIMGYIYSGYKNNDIAALLNIAPNTVKKHLTNIYSKLEITSKTELLKFIMDNNLHNIWND